MIKKVKTILLILLILLFIFLLSVIIFETKYKIKGFILAYVIIGITILFALRISISIINKNCTHRRMVNIILIALISFITIFICIIIKGIGNELVSDEKYYSLDIKDVPEKYDIYLYEYNAFHSTQGYLCLKKNNIIYKKISGTSYTIESGHSLLDQDNLFLTYDPQKQVITMKYRWDKNSSFTEITTSLDD